MSNCCSQNSNEAIGERGVIQYSDSEDWFYHMDYQTPDRRLDFGFYGVGSIGSNERKAKVDKILISAGILTLGWFLLDSIVQARLL